MFTRQKQIIAAEVKASVGRYLYLNIVGDKYLSQVKHLEHGCGRVVRDGVPFEDVLGGSDFPSQPPLVERSVATQKMWQPTRLTAAAA